MGGVEGVRGPDRVLLGRPLVDEVVRGRLVDALAERWNARLVTVVAPGGYGKSIALAQAIRDNDDDPSGVDIHIRCRPPLGGLSDLEAQIAQAFGTPSVPTAEGAALATRIADLLSGASPQQVCLCLDDVHVMADLPAFAELLEVLTEALPFNGHLLLSGRSLPSIRSARLRANDDLVEIAESDLAFDDAELAVLAGHHGVPPEQLESAAGWPAVSRLLVVADRGVSVEFMIEEVIGRLTPTERTVLALAVIAAPATRILLDDLVPEADVPTLLGAVPLMSDVGDGAVAAHDMWHEVLDSIINRDEQQRLARRVVEFQDEQGDVRGAVDTALRASLWSAALAPMMSVLTELDVNVDVSQLDRWLSLLPATVEDTPEWAVLSGVVARLHGDAHDSTALIRRALADFEAAGDLDGATTAVIELGLRSWMLSDDSLWTDVVEAGGRIIEAGGERMQRVATMAYAVELERIGDFAGALEIYESLPDRSMLESGHAWMLALLAGDLDRALVHLATLVDQSPLKGGAAQVLVTRWEAGDPVPLLTAPKDVMAQLSAMDSRDAARRFTAQVMIGASRGMPIHIAALESSDIDQSRRQGLVALTRAAKDLFVDAESVVAERFDATLDVVGWDDPLLGGELRRYLPIPYLLSPRCRQWLDDCTSLGPVQVRLRALAQAILAGRAGQPIGELPPPESILTWLPLPWSIELAVRLVGADDARGVALLEVLSDVTGAAAHAEVRRLRDRGGPLEAAADRVLAEIPGPPARAMSLRVCGGFELRHDDGQPEEVRLRVRQLLSLLTLRAEWTRRQLIDVLWPGDEARARTNLRTTLSHARRAVEPGRKAGEASFLLRQRDDRVWLQRSEYSVVDLWDIEQLLDDADTAEENGRAEQAIECRRAALGRWSPDSLSLAADVGGVEHDIEARRRRLLSAGGWVAERLLAAGNTGEALGLAKTLLAIDPLAERAHDVAIGAHLTAGALAEAGEAISQLQDALDSLGAEPSAGSMMLVRRYERRRSQLPPDAFAIANSG